MDTTTLTFYAAVCGLLGLIAPWLGNMVFRLIIGGIIGLIAAGALPLLRASFGL